METRLHLQEPHSVEKTLPLTGSKERNEIPILRIRWGPTPCSPWMAFNWWTCDSCYGHKPECFFGKTCTGLTSRTIQHDLPPTVGYRWAGSYLPLQWQRENLNDLWQLWCKTGNGMWYPHWYGIGDHRVMVIEFSAFHEFDGVYPTITTPTAWMLSCRTHRNSKSYWRIITCKIVSLLWKIWMMKNSGLPTTVRIPN